MTLKEVSDFLGIPLSTTYKLANNGQLPAIKIGPSWRVFREHLTVRHEIVNLAFDNKKTFKDDMHRLTRHGGYLLQREPDENTHLFLTTSSETDLSALGLQAHFSGLVIHVLEDQDIPEMGQ